MAVPDIREWLASLGLEQHAEAFIDNEIDWELLPRLDHAVLKDLGVHAAGQRLRILSAAAAIAAAPGPATPTTPPEAGAGAERRQLTVMFCDLVGSTALAVEQDLEDYRELLSAYQSRSVRAIERYDGYIARYMGDGLLVYFGFPHAHEDDAERALRAALDIVSAVSTLAIAGNEPARVRIGIATGEVVVGDIVGEGASEERAVLGETPSLAARLQTLAAPGEVLLSRRTRALAGRLFDYADAGRLALKGFPEPLQVWRLCGEAVARSRFEATRSPDRAALSGRDGELMLLLDRWQRVLDGEGQVVLLSGEPGIGKSRLAHALRTRIAPQAPRVVALQCSPHHGTSAFYPIVEHIRRELGIAPSDDEDARLSRLSEKTSATPELGRLESAIAALLTTSPRNASRPDPAAEPDFVPMLTDWLIGTTSGTPTLLIVEDAQWADPSTEDVLGSIINRVSESSVLVLVTHRPGYLPPWADHGHITAHSLARLGRAQVNAMVASMTGEDRLGQDVRDEIARRSDGVPLFVEELTRAVLEEPAPVQGSARVPSTLHDSLIGRLDRLGEAKRIAQIAAVIGRDFELDLLAEVSRLDATAVADHLARLEAAEVVVRRRHEPRSTYHFRHALVQDIAYASLLRRHRQDIHARVGAALESRFPETAARVPELVAHHYTEARRVQAAIDWWWRAADRALERSTLKERAAHLEAALALVVALEDEAERQRRELELQIARGGALMAVQGYQAEETGAAFERARILAGQTGDVQRSFAALRGLHGVYYARGDVAAALEVARECLRIAGDGGDDDQHALAQRLVGQSLFAHGEFTDAAAYLEAASRPLTAPQPRRGAALTGGGHHLMAPVFLAQVLWLRGKPDSALALARSGLEQAQAHFGAFAVSTHVFFLCWILGWRGEFDALAEQAERVRRLARDHELFGWMTPGGLVADWPRLATSPPAEAAALAYERIEPVRAQGGVTLPFKLALLAQAIASESQDDARTLIEEALALAERGEGWCEAELHRIQGVIEADRDAGSAMRSFQRALSIAAEQGALGWQLRTATSIASQHLAENRPEAGRQVLLPVLRCFDEGEGTIDLVRAHAVAQRLGIDT